MRPKPLQGYNNAFDNYDFDNVLRSEFPRTKRRSRLVEVLLPQYIRARVRYYHEGNSSDIQRQHIASVQGGHSPSYVAECRLVDINRNRCIGYGVSACSPKDNPSRKIARAIAVGRAMKNATQRYELGVRV